MYQRRGFTFQGTATKVETMEQNGACEARSQQWQECYGVAMRCKVASHMTESCSGPSSARYIVDTLDSTLGGIKNPREDSLHTRETPICAAPPVTRLPCATRHASESKARHYFEPNIGIYFGPLSHFLPPVSFFCVADDTHVPHVTVTPGILDPQKFFEVKID